MRLSGLAAIFLFLFIVNWQDGGVNPNSRFAAIRAITVDHRLEIDAYKDWTPDWAKGPNGHYYSNKAPGPALVAVPLAMALTKIAPTPNLHEPPAPWFKTLFSFLFQILPFAILGGLSIQLLDRTKVTHAGQVFAAAALFFGNTASYFMSTYFGHGMAAVWLLALFLALHTRRYFWVGTAMGWALLTDYGSALLFLPVTIILVLRHTGQHTGQHTKFWGDRQGSISRTLLWIGLGGLLPGILWIAYHTHCFGSPFTISQQYQNPEFVQDMSKMGKLSSVIGILPSLEVVRQLLIGPTRGLLFSQPWVLLVIPLAIFSRPKKLPLELFWLGVLGLFELFWMNACFSGWHGGWSAGPRYMSMIFPLVALVAGYVYDAQGRAMQKILWVTLFLSVFLGALIYTGEVTLPVNARLWNFYSAGLVRNFPNRRWLSFLVFVFLVYGWMITQLKRIRQESRMSTTPRH